MESIYATRERDCDVLVAALINAIYNEHAGDALRACQALRILEVNRLELIESRERVRSAEWVERRWAAVRERYHCEPAPMV